MLKQYTFTVTISDQPVFNKFVYIKVACTHPDHKGKPRINGVATVPLRGKFSLPAVLGMACSAIIRWIASKEDDRECQDFLIKHDRPTFAPDQNGVPEEIGYICAADIGSESQEFPEMDAWKSKGPISFYRGETQ